MTKREFFCLTPGDMLISGDEEKEEYTVSWGIGLVLARRRLGRGRVQIVVQWRVSSEKPFVLKYYSDSIYDKRGAYTELHRVEHTTDGEE